MGSNWLNLLIRFKNLWSKAEESFSKFMEKEVEVAWYKNVFHQENTRHRFHLVSPSPWPLFASIAATTLLVGMLFWMHFIVIGEQFHHPLFLGFIIVLMIMFVWFRDIIREGVYLGYHTKIVQKGLKIGFILFLVSEIMFFFCLFWAYFHSSLNPSIWIGGIWPPEGIIHFYLNENFDTLFTVFNQNKTGHTSRFVSTTSEKLDSIISPLRHSEHVYFPTYDPTACFDRIYLFYQNMFFYSPNGKIPLTYSFSFEQRRFEETYIPELERETQKLFDKNKAYRISSAFNYYYSEPLYFSIDISSKERYISDKYVFFMFFIKEILKETSVFFSFLEQGFSDSKVTENFLTKKLNTIFLNLFYKFYQAPAIINYWTFQHHLSREIILSPKFLSSDNLIFNHRSLGEPFLSGWPRFIYDLSAFNGSKHGLNWFLYNNSIEDNSINWSKYFDSVFKNYTYHFLDTFFDDNSVTSSIGSDYSNLKKLSSTNLLSNTDIFKKILLSRDFFLSGALNSFDYETRYFLDNFDCFFGLDKKKRLFKSYYPTDFTGPIPDNLLIMSDFKFLNSAFDNVAELNHKASTTKKLFATMFTKICKYNNALNVVALFFSNKNFQIQLKHFYADMSEDVYLNSLKALNLFFNNRLTINLAVSKSKLFNYGDFFKYLNTLDDEFYKKFNFESDPIVAGAKIYSKAFKIFSYRSELFENYNHRWFLSNVDFNKHFSVDYAYDFLNKNYFTHYYALPNLIIITESLVSLGTNELVDVGASKGIKFIYNLIDGFNPGKGIWGFGDISVGFFDWFLTLPFNLFDQGYWFDSINFFKTFIVNYLKFNEKFNQLDGLVYDEVEAQDFDNFDEVINFISVTFEQFLWRDYFFYNSHSFYKNLKYNSSFRHDLFSNFINNKIELYYKLYDIYMGGMSVYTGRFVEHSFKRFDHVYFVLSVFDKGLLIDPNKIPWLNTIILITSGLAVTVSHVYFKARKKYISLFFLALTIGLSCFFLKIQMLEYIHASFSINDGIYGSVFYMLTGFHGFHVLVGTLFLTVCFFRILIQHFMPSRHIAFEFAIWYWHFVDVVWIGLYFFVYYWPNNYFFYYHRLWQNSIEVSTDGVSSYLCMMQYPLSTIHDYILGKAEDFVPHLRTWDKFIKVSNDNELLNYNRKLMSLCKYDRFQRENLIEAIFINHFTTEFMYNWDGYYYGDRFMQRKCLRDYEMWWFWEDSARIFRNEFNDFWTPWWYILMEVFFTGRTLTRSTIRRDATPYWD